MALAARWQTHQGALENVDVNFLPTSQRVTGSFEEVGFY